MKEKTVLLPKSNVLLSVYGTKQAVQFPDSAAPTAPQAYGSKDLTDVQNWGTTNNLPKENREKLAPSTTAMPLIVKWVEMVFGMGVYYYELKKENNRIYPVYPEYPEIDEFVRNNNINYVVLERMMDFKVNWNLFAQLLPNIAGNKIVRVKHLEAEFSRFGKISSENMVQNILYKGDWSSSDEPTDIPFLDSTLKMDLESLQKEMAKKKTFAIHSCFPSPGHSLYATPPHQSIFEKDGWLDYALSVPKIMNAINKNAGNIRYHVRIPANYWESNIDDWETKSDEEQKLLIEEKIQEMDEWFSSIQNSGKIFYTHFNVDEVTGKPMTGWEIIEIGDKEKKDKYLTSVQEADIQVSRALNIDTSLSGIQATGGKLGAGSGSDKEAGYQQALYMSHAASLVIFDFLYVIGVANGWSPNLRWGFLAPSQFSQELNNQIQTAND